MAAVFDTGVPIGAKLLIDAGCGPTISFYTFLKQTGWVEACRVNQMLATRSLAGASP